MKCSFCTHDITGPHFEQNGKKVHWACVRIIVGEALDNCEIMDNEIDNRADAFAIRLGFKNYDEYEKDVKE